MLPIAIVIIIALIALYAVSLVPVTKTTTSTTASTSTSTTSTPRQILTNYTENDYILLSNLSSYSYYLLTLNEFSAQSFMSALGNNTFTNQNTTVFYNLTFTPKVNGTNLIPQAKITNITYAKSGHNVLLKMFYVQLQNNSETIYAPGIALDTVFIINNTIYGCTYFKFEKNNLCYSHLPAPFPQFNTSIKIKRAGILEYRGVQCTYNEGSFVTTPLNGTPLSGNFTTCFSNEYGMPIFANLSLSNSSTYSTIKLVETGILNYSVPINASSLPFPVAST